MERNRCTELSHLTQGGTGGETAPNTGLPFHIKLSPHLLHKYIVRSRGFSYLVLSCLHEDNNAISINTMGPIMLAVLLLEKI